MALRIRNPNPNPNPNPDKGISQTSPSQIQYAPGKKTKKSTKNRSRIIAIIAAIITIIIISIFDPGPNSNSNLNNNSNNDNALHDSTPIIKLQNDDVAKEHVGPRIDTTTTKSITDTTRSKQQEQQQQQQQKQHQEPQEQQRQEMLSDPSRITKARKQIQEIRQQFDDRYGGKKEATQIFQRGVTTAGTTDAEKERALQHTAERIILAARRRRNSSPSESSSSLNANKEEGDDDALFRKFTMSFGGYSVTVGRGNHFSQSYPFVLQKILAPVFATLDVDLVVRNGAIGGIPSFPYGFCLPNFLGADSDVVSWDYGMNEGNGAEAFEAYVRQSVATLPKRPMMIILDTKSKRVNLLNEYHKNGALLDSIAVGKGEVISKGLLALSEDERPSGLKKWDEWGSPKGSPGQSKWHPKFMEHELIAWMMATHFLDPLEKALSMLEAAGAATIVIDPLQHQNLDTLPEPITSINQGNPDETVPFLLYGSKLEDQALRGTTTPWHIHHVSCRTSFLPNLHGHMSSIIVSGVVEDNEDELSFRDDKLYSIGWVPDVGKVERETKRKVEAIGGLGYIDMKLALYGIKESGTLRLWLPHPNSTSTHDSIPNGKHISGDATNWFETLVFCEVNEKRGDKECKMTSDMSFIVGGVPSVSVVQITDAASYLSKHICVNVKIPQNAKITERKDVEPIGNGSDGRMAPMDEAEHKNVGLTVDVAVISDTVTRNNGACSISHVVWQSL